MKSVQYVICASLIAAFSSAEAITASRSSDIGPFFTDMNDQRLVNGEPRPLVQFQLAKETTTTTTTEKTKTKTKTNDGRGNKTKNKTKTTTTTTTTSESDSTNSGDSTSGDSGGWGGASYEGY